MSSHPITVAERIADPQPGVESQVEIRLELRLSHTEACKLAAQFREMGIWGEQVPNVEVFELRQTSGYMAQF